MGLTSILSVGSVAGQTAVVVENADASLQMMRSLQQSEQAAEASYEVNLDALQKQCQAIDERLRTEEEKVSPVNDKLEELNYSLGKLQDEIYKKESVLNKKLIAVDNIRAGETDRETESNQYAREVIAKEIQALEEYLSELKVREDWLRQHIEDIEQLRRKVQENIKMLTSSSSQVHRERDYYESEGRIAIARIRDEAEQNERVCQRHYDVTQEIIASRQCGR